MKFVIMADGKEERWKSHLGTSKHLVEIEGEKLICRTIRLLLKAAQPNTEIIVTSHDKAYDFDNCRRYEPLNNVLEIDRFTEELIEDDMCFLYGDTYYTADSIKTIVETQSKGTVFFGNPKSIVAVKIQDSDEFRKHKHKIRDMFLAGEISQCKGWQIYQSFCGQDLNKKPVLEDGFVLLDEQTTDINTPEDYNRLIY